ncbi:MAG: galactose 1-dehydrogenase [Hyphomicrobiales bacterium]|nr:MAG: galactose 1-dehydrogenase [Hyphomicrobiales bacterium]
MAEKIALVGIGKIAVDQHIPSIQAGSEWELAATVSRNASVDGVESYTELNALLAARPDIKTISLAIPPQPRFAYAEAALKAGRHVMLEKPPGATLSECHKLEALAKDAGVTLFATWHSRYANAVEATKTWLQDRTITSVEIVWKEDVRRWHPGQEWIWQAGGLGVFDPGINALSVLTEILPQQVHLSSAELEFPENRDTPIAANLVFDYPGGAPVNAVFDWRHEGRQTWDIDVVTNDGKLHLSNGGATLYINDNLVQEGPDREYAALYHRMAQLVANGKSDVDLSPMVHVADAFTLGRRIVVAPFHF